MAGKAKFRVGVIGLGSMGMGVACTLARKGFETHAFDVRPEVLKAFVNEGGVAHESPAEVGRAADVIVVLVVNADQTSAALFGKDGAAAALAKGSVVVASATVAPEFAIDLGERLASKGIHMIDAPVSGGAARAAKGELSIMASGSRDAFKKADAVLAAIATKVYRLGDEPGMGSKVKMINQLLAGVHIASACEAIALGIRAGADPNVLYEVISNSAGSSWMFQNRVPHILEGDYTPLSAVAIFVKDLGIVLDSAKKMSFPLPLTAAAHQLYLAAAGAGLAGEDDSAVVKVYQQLSGIKLPEKKKTAAKKS
ncbi:MAG TPA: L-threonate dehydrogenase [Burkholderiales bacterium]|nr:L-threonate dehydrogenase [Burkholderiales bacterium]